MRRMVWLSICWVALSSVGAGTGPAPTNASGLNDSPYLSPSFRTLMEAVTFHLSFDADSLMPDMAEGPKHAPQIHGSWDRKHDAPIFADGLVGRALVLGTGTAIYPSAGNVPLASRGSMAFWIKPEKWRRPNGSNVTFVTAGGEFYLQRQGPAQADDGAITRQEGIQYLVKSSPAQKHFIHLGAGIWENGKWYLLVANWSWPRMSLSVNGGPFHAISLPGRPANDMFQSLSVGSGGGGRALMDELLAFRRPLTAEEAQLLYSVGRSRPPGQAGTRPARQAPQAKMREPEGTTTPGEST